MACDGADDSVCRKQFEWEIVISANAGIPIEQRAEAAVIAWLRHQTTAYDHMTIERVKGAEWHVARNVPGRDAVGTS